MLERKTADSARTYQRACQTRISGRASPEVRDFLGEISLAGRAVYTYPLSLHWPRD